MANPTTNFGWVMPTSTSLVTNLPADFNTFGQGVDTSMAQLKGGTTGQVLSKTSGTDMAFTWVTPTDQTPLTTKGDLFAFSTVDARLAVGANETRLVADSTQTVGLKYVADTTNYAINAKADLLVGTAADTLAALTVGTNGQVLTADSTVSPTGLKWASPSAAAISGCRVTIPSTYAISNSTLTTLTWGAETYDTDSYHDNSTNNSRITIPTGKSGYYLITQCLFWAWSNSGYRQHNLTKNGTNVWSAEWGTTGTSNISSGANSSAQMVLNLAAGDYLEIKCKQDSGGNLSMLGNDVGQTNPSFFSVVYLGA